MRWKRALPAGLVLHLALGGLAVARDNSGMFDFLRQNLDRQRQMQPAPPPQRVAPRPQQTAPRAAPVPVAVPQSRAYCVRTCDGYYFAVGFAQSQNQINSQREMCASSCGDAPMKLYVAPVAAAPAASSAPAIERAIDDAGQPYTALPTAYGFRNHEDPACACKSTSTGLPQIPISIDPTLRPGDIVVMGDGVKVFRGATQTPHTDEDFTPVASSRNLPDFVRRQMLSLQEHIAPQ